MSSVADVMERKERPAYVRFETRAIEDKAASLKEGHYVGKDVDYALVTPPYSKDVIIFKVDQWLQQLDVDLRNDRIPKAWVDRYREEYQAWKRGQQLPLRGTPIKGWGVISPAQQETLIRMNVLTVEDLAAMNAEGIGRIGMGGITMKDKAAAWLSQVQDKGPLTQEIAAVKARNRELEASVETLSKQVEKLAAMVGQPVAVVEKEAEISAADLLEEETPQALTREQLVAAYTAKFNKAPHHRMADKTIAEALK